MGEITAKGWYKRPWDGAVCWAAEQDGQVFGFHRDHLQDLRTNSKEPLIDRGYFPMADRYVREYTFYATREEAEAHTEAKPWDPQETNHG